MLIQLPYLIHKKNQARKGSGYTYPYVSHLQAPTFLGFCLEISKSSSFRCSANLYLCLLSSCSWVSDFQTSLSLLSKVWLKYVCYRLGVLMTFARTAEHLSVSEALLRTEQPLGQGPTNPSMLSRAVWMQTFKVKLSQTFNLDFFLRFNWLFLHLAPRISCLVCWYFQCFLSSPLSLSPPD